MKLIFFHTPKPKQFHYSARYYDEEKDRIEQRKKALGLESDGDSGDLRSRISSGWNKFKKTDRRTQKKANISVLVYIFVVILLIYLIFFR
jgi:hypothetical protein